MNLEKTEVRGFRGSGFHFLLVPKLRLGNTIARKPSFLLVPMLLYGNAYDMMRV